jgi:hypothetical protein
MKTGQIRIVSDGTSLGTNVFGPDGSLLSVTKIEILAIETDSGFVTAILTCVGVELDMIATKETESDESKMAT